MKSGRLVIQGNYYTRDGDPSEKSESDKWDVLGANRQKKKTFVLKNVPFGNMIQIGIVRRSENCAILKHVQIGIMRRYDKCAILKRGTVQTLSYRGQT